MKILFVTMGGLAGGATASPKVIAQKAQAISRLGHTVLLVTDDPGAYLVARDGRFEPRPFPRASYLLHRTLRRRADRLLAARGIPAPERPQFHCAFDLGMAFRVLLCAAREGAEVLHAEKLGYVFPCLPARRLRGMFLVLVEHDVESQRLAETCSLGGRALRFLTGFERRGCRAADAVVTVSREDADRLAGIGVERARLHVIPHGVEAERFARGRGDAVRRARGLKGGVVGIIHGTASYLPNREALDALVGGVIPALARAGVDFTLLAVGPDPPASSPSPRVIFTGTVPEKELPDHLAAADVAILPIRSGGGTRLKILEYFAAGVPVVSTAKGAEGLGAEDGRHLLLAETDEEMAACAARLARDPGLRARVVANARAFAAAREWGAIAPRFVELYSRGVLRGRPGAPPGP